MSRLGPLVLMLVGCRHLWGPGFPEKTINFQEFFPGPEGLESLEFLKKRFRSQSVVLMGPVQGPRPPGQGYLPFCPLRQRCSPERIGAWGPVDRTAPEDYQRATQQGRPVVVSGAWEEVSWLAQKFPKLSVVWASTKNLDEMENLLGKHPNVWVATSFSDVREFLKLLREVKKRTQEYRDFYVRYSQRILFATGFLSEGPLPEEALYWMSRAMVEFFEKEGFTFFAPPQVKEARNFQGLALPPEVLKRLYYENARELLSL